MLTGEFVSAAYFTASVALAGVMDLCAFFATYSSATRFLALGLVTTFLDSWLFHRLSVARECSEVGGGAAVPLDKAIQNGLAASINLAYNIAFAGTIFSRMLRPRVLLGKRPRTTFSTSCNDPLNDE